MDVDQIAAELLDEIERCEDEERFREQLSPRERRPNLNCPGCVCEFAIAPLEDQ